MRPSRGAVCPKCDAPAELGASLCDYCGVTLGEPPRRSGVTQRALALDEEAARLMLAPVSRPAVVSQARPSVVRSFWDAVLVVATFGIGWFWLRRRAT